MEKKTLAELCADAEVQAKAWNTAMFEKNLDIAAKANASLETIEKDYLAQAQLETFAACAEAEKPMLAAIEKFSFQIIRHVDKTDHESELTTRELVKKDRQIDLLRFEEYCQKTVKTDIANDPMWKFMVQRFNQLLCIRAARELKIDPKAIADSYYLAEKAKEIEMGKTPDSNTQILKQLQSCIDAIIFEDDGKGKNAYKADSHDVAYLLMTYTRKGKNALSVATANHSTIRNQIGAICYRIVTKGAYTLEYKENKKTTETAAKTDAKAA